MTRVRHWVLAVLLLAFATPVLAETASQVFQQVSPSVVVVVTYDAAGKPAELGSGVVLPNHDVATNCHVLKDGTQYRVRYRNKDYPARLDKSDWDRDVCSLTVPGLPARPVVLGNTKTLQVGAPVYAIGTPEGLQLTLSEGIVSSLRPVGGGSYIQTTAAISPGSSGGGLFDDQGRLLGLTSFFVSQGQQLNFALPVEWIEALPQRSTQRVAQRTSEVDWLNRAAALETKKDWRGLMALAERWTRASPNSGTAWIALGEAYDGTVQPEQAIDAYRQALQINPQDADTWSNLGVDYAAVRQYTQAIDANRQALQIKPQNADIWANLGADYAAVRQYAQAIDANRQALQIKPRYAMVWDNLGKAYYAAGQHAQAIAAFRQALQIKPQDADAWYNLGTAYDGAGQHSEAIAAYREALKINPQYADAWSNLGGAYAKAEKYSQSIGALRQALQVNPQDAKAWFDLGLVYKATGQNAQALAAYQHLKTLSPELAQKLFDLIVPK